MHEFLSSIYHYVYQNWPTILALFGGGAGVSVILETVLHHFKVDSKRVAFTLLNAFSVLATLSDYLINSGSTFSFLPVYASLLIAAQFIHRFAVSPIYTAKIQPYLQWKAENPSVDPTTIKAAEPTDSVPISPATPQVQVELPKQSNWN